MICRHMGIGQIRGDPQRSFRQLFTAPLPTFCQADTKNGVTANKLRTGAHQIPS